MHTRSLFVLVVFVATLGAQGTVTSTAPSSVQAGVASFLMAVNGSGFTSANIVQWDGANLTTQFASANQLAATVTASLVASGGSHSIRVKQSASVNVFSNAVSFTVNNPVPTITSISPGSAVIGSPALTVDYTGTHFVPASIARLGGVNLATTFVSATHIQGFLPASMMANLGFLAVEVFNPSPGGGTVSTGVFVVQNQIPTLASVSPTAVTASAFATSLTANGAGYNVTSVVRFDGSPLTTTLVSSTQVTAAVPAALIGIGGNHTITVDNPGSGGGTSPGQAFTVVNPIPNISSVSPGTVIAGVPTTLTIHGSGFNPSTTARDNTNAIPTTFTNSSVIIQATFTPAISSAGTPHQISVANPAPGGGPSAASFAVIINNPVPVISSISASVVSGGGPDALVAVFGAQFVPSTTADASGTPLTATFVSSSQLNLAFPASLQRTIRRFSIRLTNPGPGGGSASIPFTINGPAISSCTPAVVPVMNASSPPITLVVNGGSFQAGDQIRIDGLAQSTTLVNVATLQCTLTGSFAVLLQPGGFAVTVTRAGSISLVSSNAFGVPVGIAGTPDNAGTVTLAPAPPAPGQAFNLRVELPVANVPVTLFAEIPPPSTIMLNITPGFDVVIGPGLNSPIVVTDGLGLFGPATPTLAAPYDLSFFGIPAGHGVFEIRDIGAPAVPIGITFSVAAIYADPASPVGLNATHVGGPFSL